jgi:hypothetical protein
MDLTSQAAADLMTFLKSDRQLSNRKLQTLNRASIDEEATTFKIREDYIALFRIILS